MIESTPIAPAPSSPPQSNDAEQLNQINTQKEILKNVTNKEKVRAAILAENPEYAATPDRVEALIDFRSYNNAQSFSDGVKENSLFSEEEKKTLLDEAREVKNPLDYISESNPELRETIKFSIETESISPEDAELYLKTRNAYIKNEPAPEIINTEPSNPENPTTPQEPAERMDETLYGLLTNPRLNLDKLKEFLTPEEFAKLPNHFQKAQEQTRSDLEKIDIETAQTQDEEKKKQLALDKQKLEENKTHLENMISQMGNPTNQPFTTHTPADVKKMESDYLINARRLKEIEEAKKTADEQRKKELEQEETKLKSEQEALIKGLSQTPQLSPENKVPVQPNIIGAPVSGIQGHPQSNGVMPVKQKEVDHAAINEVMAGSQPEEPQESWWSRNSSWIWWTLAGIAAAVVGVLGFRKGGWFNKDKKTENPVTTAETSNTSTASTANTVLNTATNDVTNTGSTLENSGTKINTATVDQTNTLISNNSRSI